MIFRLFRAIYAQRKEDVCFLFSQANPFKNGISKVQVIVTFLSVLELIKMGHIHVVQEEIFDDIQINVVTEPETWKNLTEFAEEEG